MKLILSEGVSFSLHPNIKLLGKMSLSSRNGGSSSGGSEIINDAGGRERNITISITGQDGSTVLYSTPRNLEFRELFLNYCRRKQLIYRTARFLHKGVRVLGRCTPAELNLEDGAELSCMLHQMGGGFNTMPATTKLSHLIVLVGPLDISASDGNK